MHTIARTTAMSLFMILLLAAALTPVTSVPISESERDLSRDDQETRLCLTPECIDTAARIRQFIDPSVDPCENFYEFACGGWIKNQVLPPWKSAYYSFGEVDKMIPTVRNYLGAEPEPSDLSSVVKAKNMYTSCITYANKARENQELKDFITEEFGVWPLTLEEWDESEFDFEEVLTKAVGYGVSVIVRLDAHPSFEIDKETGLASSKHRLWMFPPTFGLPDLKYYLSETDHMTLQIYKEKIFKVAQTFGVENEARARKDIEDILDLEIALANISIMASGYEGNGSMTLTDLEDRCAELIDWRSFVMGLLSSPDIGVKELPDNRVSIYTGYFQQLGDFLPTVEKRTLANYIIWRVLFDIENTLIPGDERMNFLYREILEGQRPAIPAEESCLEYVSTAFDMILHRLLYAEKFPEEEMHRIKVMMHKIHNVFEDKLEETEWLDVYTKTAIIEKSRVIETVFLFFDRATNDTYLENYYSNLTINRENFINNLLLERQENVKRNLRLLGLPSGPLRVEVTGLPWDIAAYIVFQENIIRFSAGIFEPPFFTYNVPQSLNYGAIGVVLGHELTHAFDAEGYKYNEEGIKGEWWSEEAIEKFKQSHLCMIDQYSRFYMKEADMYVDGNQTLGENIADNGGLSQSFRAYRSWICSRGEEEETLPALPYTNNQLFFINYGQVWCSVLSQDYAKEQINYDPHSPARFRVNGAVQNSEEFAEAFNCPAGSNMNPSQKCEVW